MDPMMANITSSTIEQASSSNSPLAYAAVASGLALFGTFFFVIPQFKDAFR